LAAAPAKVSLLFWLVPFGHHQLYIAHMRMAAAFALRVAKYRSCIPHSNDRRPQ
jgi:hypothetical protein